MNENLESFNYTLPAEKIAKYPLADRSSSKLVFYEHGLVSHHSFSNIPELIPSDSLLVMNDTKVIPARIHIQKETGAKIEIFLLSPVSPSTEVASAMLASGNCSWKCMIGNAKKWKIGLAINRTVIDQGKELIITVTREGQDVINFSYPDNMSFSALIEAFGSIPLPPYLNREVRQEDKDSYQTVYSQAEGAVAAPTAGLHFTDAILEQIKSKGIKQAFTTLHVSAGTFQPISVDNIKDHPMHTEQMVVNLKLVEQVANHKGNIIPVGTTSMRTLESLYWFGVKLQTGSFENTDGFNVDKEDPYRDYNDLPDRTTAFESIGVYMKKHGLEEIVGETSIFIFPGYQFRVCNGIITNFHLPKSTLILLIAALIGNDWRKVYHEALENDYRFLSYGDSSLLLP